MVRKLNPYEGLTDSQLREKIEAPLKSQESKKYAASKLAQWFEINITIKIFGFTILELCFPPKDVEK